MKHLTPYEKRTLDRIAQAVATYNDTEKETLFHGQDDETCLMRYLCYTLAHYQFKIPISKIQLFFGHKQHGTVINGLNRIRDWQSTTKEIKVALEVLTSSLQDIPLRKLSRQLEIPSSDS